MDSRRNRGSCRERGGARSGGVTVRQSGRAEMTDDDESWRAGLHRDLVGGRRRKSKRPSHPYDTARWKARRTELRDGATCVLCARFGLATMAQVADHIIPALDTEAADFYDAPLQALCLDCHKIKRKIESAWRRRELNIRELDLSQSREGARLRAASFGVGVDGFPLVRWSDPR
jgi:5-methylcytosine-specific restriction endonuclease McrA